MIDLMLALAAENQRNGDWASAEILYRGLLKDHPGHPAAALSLGGLLRERGDLEESGKFLGLAVDGAPDCSEAHIQQAQLWQALGKPDRALQSLMIATSLQGVKVNPNDVQARFALAVAFNRADHHRDAAAAYRQALALQPGFDEIHNNLGISLQNLLRSDEAVTAHRRAVQVTPNNAGHHANLAHALLASGHLREGFAEWEWRTPSPKRDFTQPKWNGAPLVGKTLLAHAEQGYGDTIQFCRYLPLAAARGGRVVVECRAPLSGLLRRMPGVSAVVEWGQPLPHFDVQIAIPSLPFALGLDSVEPSAPYLKASAERLAFWKERAGAASFKVGLVWAGNAAGLDPKRAISAADITRLADVPGVSLFSLQRDAELSNIGARLAEDFGPSIADFDDLAAAIESLDLLISVDTAAAHLAGAMGKPVWTLLHASPDWRWLPASDTTPWYRSMRLFRQTAAGDWSNLVARVASELAGLSETRRKAAARPAIEGR